MISKLLAAHPRRPLIMGIINITPDSFSGDGLLTGASLGERVINLAAQMRHDGADLLDIGGESSRPGARAIPVDVETNRVVPMIAALHASFPDLPLSIDTTKPAVAEAALAAGASLINDISGLDQDPAMRKVAAAHQVPLVLMHNQARVDAVQYDPLIGSAYEAADYGDVVAEVKRELLELANGALEDGVASDKIILDPGIGFGKTPRQNRCLINCLDEIVSLGFPVLLGASRKSFIGETLHVPPDERLEGTAAAIAMGVLRGASILRVHDVKFMTRVARMITAITSAC